MRVPVGHLGLGTRRGAAEDVQAKLRDPGDVPGCGLAELGDGLDVLVGQGVLFVGRELGRGKIGIGRVGLHGGDAFRDLLFLGLDPVGGRLLAESETRKGQGDERQTDRLAPKRLSGHHALQFAYLVQAAVPTERGLRT